MTRRALVVLGLFLFSLSAGIITSRDLFFNLSYVWAGLLAVSYFWSWSSLRGISLKRERMTSRVQVGQLFQQKFTIYNDSSLPKLWLDIRDETELPGYKATALSVLGLIGSSDMLGDTGSAVFHGLRQGEDRSYRVRTMCTQRGRFALGPTEMHGGDPFGLFPTERIIPVREYVVVLPAVVDVHSFPIPTGRLPGGEALRRRTHQVTPNASGIRDYEPGDSLNRIHWRSTAKLDRLIVKEFEFDPLADVWIIIDADGDRQYERPSKANEQRNGSKRERIDLSRVIPNSSEEYAVSIAASLAFHFMERDRNVGLIARGQARHAIQPERGQAQLFRLLESLAVLNAVGEHSLSDVLKIEGDLIPRGATVILITADTRPEIVHIVRDLKRLGKMPILLLLEAESFGGPSGSSRILEAARQEGALGKMIRCGEDLGEALSSPFRNTTPTLHQ